MKYQIQVNNGNENLGITGKTITVNEVCQNISNKFLSEEVHHDNPLIPVQVIESVLANFSRTAARLMSEGFAIQLMNGNDVAIRIYPDIHLKGQNINLDRARLLDPDIETEADMEAKAGELVSKCGVTVGARCSAQPKFTELLLAQGVSVTRTGDIKQVPKVLRSDVTPIDPNGDTGTGGQQNPTPDPTNGDNNGNGNPDPDNSGNGSDE